MPHRCGNLYHSRLGIPSLPVASNSVNAQHCIAMQWSNSTLCAGPRQAIACADPLAETRHLQTTTASGRHRPPPPAERAAERRMVVTQSGIPGASATVTSRGWTSSSATSSLELPPCRWSTPVRYCPKTCRCATRSSSSCASHVRAPGSRRRSCSRVRRCS